ncbi:unnamed protein product, partial [Rotaria sordida]
VFSWKRASPYFQGVIQARTAAHAVWRIIDEPFKINSNSEIGLTKDDLIGDIQFSNVYFSYPSRTDVPILTNLSFNAQCGQTIALVGSSGSGKSTCIQLLQRFYDTQSGSVLIDGKPVNEYNLKWLRQHIGVVSQEPVLFHTTIRENILFERKSATDEEIHEAAQMANAHNFIMQLPNKYETQVGERGAGLSGGQKQRIAIARAVVRNPKILLLDEATSALDNESEKLVQEALNRAAQGRTTLIIAHRLSTIRNANKIIVMQKGEVIEEGDHDSLMKAKGTYFNLVEQQNLCQAEKEEETEEELELELKQSELTKMYLDTQANSNSCAERRRKSSIISLSSQSYMFARSGGELTRRIRSKAFRAILRQDIAYFDQPKNNTGALCTRLATEASAIQGSSGVCFGYIFQNLSTMGIGILIGFVFSWHLTLLIMAFLPLMAVGGTAQIYLATRFAKKEKKYLEDAGKVAVETIQSIRTVTQLTKEEYFYNKYCQTLDNVYRISLKRIHILSILLSVTSSIFLFVQAASIAFGATLVNHGVIAFQNYLMVFNCVAITARSAVRALTLFPDYGKGIEAAETIFELLDRKPQIDNGSNEGEKIVSKRC